MEAWKARLFSALEDRLSAEGHGALTEECAKETSISSEYGASGCWLDSNKVVEYDGPVCMIVDHPVEEPFWSRTCAALPDPVPSSWMGENLDVAYLRGLHYKYVPPAVIQRKRVDRGYVLGLLNKGVPALQYGDHIDPAHFLRTMYVLSFACPEESDEPFLGPDLALALLSAGHVSLSERGLFGPPRYGSYYTYTTIRRLEHSMRITRRLWPRVFSELNVDWDPHIVDWLHDVAATFVPP